jgi:hypothetical protein
MQLIDDGILLQTKGASYQEPRSGQDEALPGEALPGAFELVR